jgi:hypothetical protein
VPKPRRPMRRRFGFVMRRRNLPAGRNGHGAALRLPSRRTPWQTPSRSRPRKSLRNPLLAGASGPRGVPFLGPALAAQGSSELLRQALPDARRDREVHIPGPRVARDDPPPPRKSSFQRRATS